MAVKSFWVMVVAFLLSGCAIQQTPSVTKIALLAPFEGQYREIGYEALYAARLAIDDSGLKTVNLLAIDDGGGEETAILRAEAIATDPDILSVLLLGQSASTDAVQQALGEKSAIIVGYWSSVPTTSSTVILANPDIQDLVNFSGDVTDFPNENPITGGEILSLAQVPQLLSDTSAIEIISSSQLPDETFRERYLNSAQFVPEPRLIAPLTYDATQMLLESIQSGTSITEIEYEGITGTIRFEDGYWMSAPVNRFGYENGRLMQSR